MHCLAPKQTLELTVLHYTLGSLHALRASSPGLAVIVASTLVVQWYRARGAAWTGFASTGLAGQGGGLWCGLGLYQGRVSALFSAASDLTEAIEGMRMED